MRDVVNEEFNTFVTYDFTSWETGKVASHLGGGGGGG